MRRVRIKQAVVVPHTMAQQSGVGKLVQHIIDCRPGTRSPDSAISGQTVGSDMAVSSVSNKAAIPNAGASVTNPPPANGGPDRLHQARQVWQLIWTFTLYHPVKMGG